MSESGAPSGRPVGPRQSPRRRGIPVHERGRIGRFWGGLDDYIRTAWWGIVTPRVSERRPLVIVQAVIVRASQSGAGREVLLSIRSDLFGWELPGGTPEPGEAYEESLAREVLEETGLRVEVEAHVGNWIRRGFRPHTARIYRCGVVEGTLTPSHETPRVAWFALDRLPEALFPWYREPLDRALRVDDEAPLEREEWQGLGTILEAMKIDLRMRWRGLP